MTWPPPVSLSGRHARLEPVALSHEADLRQAATTVGDLWYTNIPTPDGMAAEIAARLAKPGMQPFAIKVSDGRAVGMTTYLNTDEANRRVEIGATWISRDVQRTPLNTEAKFLLLRHAFETLDCIAVEFRTHRLNLQSRSAIERLGAQFDGILRAHMIMANGTIRDTACYSIIASEWPTVKAHLEAKMDR